MVRILGLDPAASFGWAVIDDEEYVAGGTKVFIFPTKAKLKKGAHKGSKWAGFQDWIAHILETYRPNIIFYEEIQQSTSRYAVQSYGYFRYTIEAAASRALIPTDQLTPPEWRKLIKLGGKADKEIVAKALIEKYPMVIFETFDHSDALGIAVAASIRLKEEISA